MKLFSQMMKLINTTIQIRPLFAAIIPLNLAKPDKGASSAAPALVVLSCFGLCSCSPDPSLAAGFAAVAGVEGSSGGGDEGGGVAAGFSATVSDDEGGAGGFGSASIAYPRDKTRECNENTAGFMDLIDGDGVRGDATSLKRYG